MIQHFSLIKGKKALPFSTSTALSLTKGPKIVKLSDSPMTAMVLVFLVCTQYIDKDNCQMLVKLS